MVFRSGTRRVLKNFFLWIVLDLGYQGYVENYWLELLVPHQRAEVRIKVSATGLWRTLWVNFGEVSTTSSCSLNS